MPAALSTSFDAMAQVDRQLLRVAAADVEPVEVRAGVEHLDRGEDALAPAAIPDAAASSVPELVLERAAAPERHEGKFQVRRGRAVNEDRGSEPCAEGDHQLEPFAGDHGEPVHVGVVREAGRLPEPALELGRQRETCPRLHELAGHAVPGPRLG